MSNPGFAIREYVIKNLLDCVYSIDEIALMHSISQRTIYVIALEANINMGARTKSARLIAKKQLLIKELNLEITNLLSKRIRIENEIEDVVRKGVKFDSK